MPGPRQPQTAHRDMGDLVCMWMFVAQLEAAFSRRDPDAIQEVQVGTRTVWEGLLPGQLELGAIADMWTHAANVVCGCLVVGFSVALMHTRRAPRLPSSQPSHPSPLTNSKGNPNHKSPAASAGTSRRQPFMT